MVEMLIVLVIGIVVVGLLLWLVENYLPIEPKFKQLIRMVAIVGLIAWIAFTLLRFAGYQVF